MTLIYTIKIIYTYRYSYTVHLFTYKKLNAVYKTYFSYTKLEKIIIKHIFTQLSYVHSNHTKWLYIGTMLL